MTDQTARTSCRTCVTPIAWIDCPTGGWWAHDTHPADEHDAVPAAWVDGDPLMEAIAAAVFEHCATEPTVSLVVDDPRNIAAVAAAVARAQQPAVQAPAADRAGNESTASPSVATRAGQNLTFAPQPTADQTALRDRIAQAIEDAPYRPEMRRSLQLADAVLAVLPAPTDRAAVLREAADALDNSERLRDYTDDHMSDINEAANELRRMAAEAQQDGPR